MNVDAITRVVSAARRANNLAGIIAKLTSSTSDNMADHIFGELADALFLFSRESASVSDEFVDSKTYNLLINSCKSNAEVANELIRMAEANKPKQPAPILMTDAEREALYGTPEGEWPM